MQHLWAPWRLSYVTKAGKGVDGPCVFCTSFDDPEQSSLTVYRGDLCSIILNKYPYSNGHLMVVPQRHIGKLSQATEAELSDLIALTRTAEVALTEAYEPHGLNIGMNLGRPAGAGAPGHLHVHIVPRWTGDTNFMTVTASTRVMPEGLDQTVDRLRPVFERLV